MTTPSHSINQATANSSWSRSPPPYSEIQNQTGPSQANGLGGLNGNGDSSTPVPVHSRKGSLMVGGGGVDIQKGNLAFGTVDSPHPLLSSSPAAPSLTGAHLSDNVKSFGSIDADSSTDTSAVKASRRSSTLSPPLTSPPPNAGQKLLDMHALFGAKPKPNGTPAPNVSPAMASVSPIHERRLSNSGFQSPNGSAHLRPPHPNVPGQSRSSVSGQIGPNAYVNGPIPAQMSQGFRPPQMRPGPLQVYQPGVRPHLQQQAYQPGTGMPTMGHSGPQGPYQMMGYPHQQYYDGYYPQQFAYPQSGPGGPPQWAPQQHPQNSQFNAPVSPRGAAVQLGPAPAHPSPAPHSANLPSNGGSPAPTPPSRPPSLMGHQPTPSNASMSSIQLGPSPSTPSRAGPTAGHSSQPSFGLSGGAASFTPRTPKIIKFSRPDGTAMDIKEAAAAVKGPTPVSSGVATPEPASLESEVPKKKVPALPVMVRLESEEQRQARVKEEKEQARIREQEEQEEQERQERKERLMREEAQRKTESEYEKACLQKEQLGKLEKDKAEKESVEKERVEKEREVEQERSEQLEKEQAEKRKIEEEAAARSTALLTPTTQSTTTSPLASPALAAAGLPPKPTGMPRRPVPSALEIKPQSPVIGDNVHSSALNTARPIEDLKTIVYPGTLQSPKPELNVDAEPGKFRYDRDFLMQFMHVCREKPENLPPLEEIGLEAESSSSGFGTSRGGRGPRSSMGPPGRGGTPTALGIGGIGKSFPGQGMGSFGMGNFGSGSLRGTTSEERYNRSLAQGRQSSMARTPSQSGPGGLAGLPSMSLSTSRSGTSRSRGGVKRAPHAASEPEVAPIVSSSNSWVKSRPTGDDEGSPAYIERKVKALLNKLTAEKFNSISLQILEWANKSAFETDGMTLKLVIKQIFEKATDEAHWSSMYARLCRLLLEQLDPAITENFDGKPVSGGMLFRKYLVGRCQDDFETGWKAREDAATAAAAKSEEDKERLAAQENTEQGEAAMLSDEYYAAQKAKRRGLGLVQLIGELYKLDMLGKGVIRTCFVKLLGNIENPDEEDIESSCKLLTTVGMQFERASLENIDIVFDRLNTVYKSETIASRIKFMIMDVIDLRKAGWESRKQQPSVMTIAEVHQQAAREQAEKSAAAAHAARESISRGGSRAGHSRRDGPQPGEWQSVAAGSRPLQRPTDFSNIGRNISSAGMPSAPTFGPSSVFNKARGKPGGTGVVTPPLSRQASTSNMFSALRDEPSEPVVERRGSNDAGETLPQRKKLNLQPRTKPLPEQDDGGDASGSDEEATVAVSADSVKPKLDTDMKELWGEKGVGGSRDPEDIVEYFRAIAEEHKTMLAERLVDEVFRSSKVKDAEVVGRGWTQSLSQAVVTLETLKKSVDTRMPSLDDDAIDFPQAYNAIAILMRSISLSKDDIAALIQKVEVDGAPRITPTLKLERALALVDGEASS